MPHLNAVLRNRIDAWAEGIDRGSQLHEAAASAWMPSIVVGLLASGARSDTIARARELLAQPRPRQGDQHAATNGSEPKMLPQPCPCCGGRMIIIETFRRGTTPRHRPAAPPAAIRIDTS